MTHPVVEEEENDFLVMGRSGKTHRQATRDRWNVDIELPASKPLNIDPPTSPTERNPDSV